MPTEFTHGYALLIGVNENQVARWALPDVAQDIAAVAEVLRHPDRCGYPAANVKSITGPDATRAGILDGLAWLAERLAADAGGDATAVLYYSGHGWRRGDGAYYLLPYDVRAGAGGLPAPASALPAADFAAAVADLAPRRLLVVLDCCHAAGLGVKGAGGDDFSSTAIPPALFMGGERGLAPGAKGLAALAQGAGRAVLSSSQGTQSSYMRRDGKMSIFTYHLIEALTGHAAPAEGAAEVLVSDVMSHVWRRVPQSARADWNAEQQPDYQVSGNFPVALLLGGGGVGKGVTPPDPLAPLPAVGPALSQKLIGRGVQAGRDVQVGGDLVLGDKIGRQINTGGGAYVEGDVRTGGGDFVGRDRVTAGGGSAASTGGVAFVGHGNTAITGPARGNVHVTSQAAGAQGELADLRALLAELSRQVQALPTGEARAEAAAELTRAVELAQRPEPPAGRIVRGLENVREIVESGVGALTAGAALAPLIARAIQLAQALLR